ncbi:MAG: mRNA surveillance protein pelota [Candidatus Heimdallarchaeota archaeon]|nr:mRNA surveillance protein pelota [Candidatus Heimdallarchaeota archaeon]
MRILKKDLKNQNIVLRPETSTDLYILSNVINIGDRVIAKTSRRIRRSGSESRSGEESQRITMVIGVEVEDFAFQESISNRLRVKGKIFEGNEQYISIGTYHTLNLELSQAITIIKPNWTKYYLQLLEEAEEASKKPKICLIAVDKAEVCIGILDNFKLDIIMHEKSHISRKRSKEKIRTKQQQTFLDQITDLINRQVLPQTKNIIIGGPGFVKEELYSFLKDKPTFKDVNIVVAGSVSGGNRVGLSELLKMDIIDKIAKDFRFLEEGHLIDEFFKRMNQGSQDITYGLNEVEKLSTSGAIETLIILDTILRVKDSSIQVQQILKEIEKTRGKIVIISSQGENAKRMKTFGGVLALLRYPTSWET